MHYFHLFSIRDAVDRALARLECEQVGTWSEYVPVSILGCIMYICKYNMYTHFGIPPCRTQSLTCHMFPSAVVSNCFNWRCVPISFQQIAADDNAQVTTDIEPVIIQIAWQGLAFLSNKVCMLQWMPALAITWRKLVHSTQRLARSFVDSTILFKLFHALCRFT